MTPECQEKLVISQCDVADDFARLVVSAGMVAWDTETSGLDWKAERLATCQLYVPGGPVTIVRITECRPSRLCSLLENAAVKKVFHHAMFDLRFMAHAWGVASRNIACTKIASKLLEQSKQGNHTLQGLLYEHLRVKIDKTERFSDWFSRHLTAEQSCYAANDVLYLIDLLNVLLERLRRAGRGELAEGCFAHIPTRVELDLGGYGDIYVY
jgi:ribonuclease D